MGNADCFDWMLLNLMKHGDDSMEIPLWAATIMGTKYNRLANLGSDLAQWSENQQVSFSSQNKILKDLSRIEI